MWLFEWFDNNDDTASGNSAGSTEATVTNVELTLQEPHDDVITHVIVTPEVGQLGPPMEENSSTNRELTLQKPVDDADVGQLEEPQLNLFCGQWVRVHQGMGMRYNAKILRIKDQDVVVQYSTMARGMVEAVVPRSDIRKGGGPPRSRDRSEDVISPRCEHISSYICAGLTIGGAVMLTLGILILRGEWLGPEKDTCTLFAPHTCEKGSPFCRGQNCDVFTPTFRNVTIESGGSCGVYKGQDHESVADCERDALESLGTRTCYVDDSSDCFAMASPGILDKRHTQGSALAAFGGISVFAAVAVLYLCVCYNTCNND